MDGQKKAYKGLPMEGIVARWYATLRRTKSQIDVYRKQAAQLTLDLPDGADVLEVAPGPGYLAIEIARRGRFHVTGLDISHSFVKIARENALQAAVTVDFKHGNAASMPLQAESFDLIVCQAAFKNFAQPVSALNEMHRVLRDGGTAVIQDMSRDATGADIDTEVRTAELGPLNGFMTRCTLRMLRRRAYSPARFERLVAESAFRTCRIQTEGIGLEVRMKKQVAA